MYCFSFSEIMERRNNYLVSVTSCGTFYIIQNFYFLKKDIFIKIKVDKFHISKIQGYHYPINDGIMSN
jgi:hypothetical protein